MKKSDLKFMNSVLRKQCGWYLEIGVVPDCGDEFFRVYERPSSKQVPNNFVGVMPICSTLGAIVSAAALCKYYRDAGMEASKAQR